MFLRLIFFVLIIVFSTSIVGQDTASKKEVESKEKLSIKFQGDSRRTFVNRKSVGIIGARIGLSINERYEFGLGVYSSNLLEF